MPLRPGPGRPKGKKNKCTLLRERLAERALQSTYVPKYAPQEVLQRVMDGDTKFTPEQIAAARDLLPFTLPKLQAVAVATPPPEAPAMLRQMRMLSTETLEMLRDVMQHAERELARQTGPVIDDAEL